MGPIRATARITSRGEKLEEREGASLVTFPHSFIFIVHVYSTVLVCIFSTVVQNSSTIILKFQHKTVRAQS